MVSSYLHIQILKEFQKDKGLKLTSKVDEKTAKKLGILSIMILIPIILFISNQFIFHIFSFPTNFIFSMKYDFFRHDFKIDF